MYSQFSIDFFFIHNNHDALIFWFISSLLRRAYHIDFFLKTEMNSLNHSIEKKKVTRKRMDFLGSVFKYSPGTICLCMNGEGHISVSSIPCQVFFSE